MQAVIKLTGLIDFNNVLELKETGERLMQKNQCVEVDFSALQSYNSAVLTLLATWKRFAKKNACEVQFSAVPPSLIALAKVCNLRSILGV